MFASYLRSTSRRRFGTSLVCLFLASTTTIALNFTDDTFARLKRERLEFEVTVPVSEIPRFVKAVVYDYGADLVGSSTAVLR